MSEDRAIRADLDLSQIEKMMEEMAGKPHIRHERQPGERCMYEIASRNALEGRTEVFKDRELG